MNLIISKTKHENLNACWEPFATSTPVKSARNRVKILRGSQNQFRKDTEYLNFVGLDQASRNISSTLQRKTSESKIVSFKKLKKNKSAAYFDLNSSTDDDSSGENKKRPIIKCSSGNATNSLLYSKNVNNLEVEVESDMQTSNTKKNKNAKLKTEISFNSKNLETQKCQTFSRKSKVRDTIEKSGCKLPNFQTGSNNLCMVIDESSLREKIMKVQVPNENKENTETDKQLLKSKKKTEGQIKRNQRNVKSVQKDHKNDVISTNIALAPKKNILPEPVGKKTKSNNSAKLLKRTREEKVDTKVGPPLCLFNAKSDDSHQLFSDSKEQEAINSLDLTSDSINELIVTSQYSSLVKENNFALKPNNSFIEKSSKTNKIGNKKSKRKKNSPEPSGMLESLDQESLKKKMNKDISTKTNNTHFKFDLKSEKKHTSKNNQKRNLRITTLKKNLVHKNNKKSDVCQNEAPKRNNKEGNLLNVSDSSETYIRESKNKNAHEIDTPVCIHLNELAFQNNHAGCFVEQCWNIKNFKCGVFKVKMESQLNWKTHHFSTMGCVLIKGEVKMKIGPEEFNINEGDMALIPPSTEWHAINVGNSESVLYYWCGNFNS